MQQVTIAPGHWLEPLAAGSYLRMRAAGCPIGITDAGRTYAEQEALYAAWLRGELTATAAVPGTSKHEAGLALDLPEPARSWVRTNGRAFGWLKDQVRNEPWHMEYRSDLDTHAVPAPITTTPTLIREDDMQITVVICDQGDSGHPEYGSTAVVDQLRGFVRTSTGLGDRGALTAERAIADALGFPVVEKHVDANGWVMAQRYTRPVSSADVAAIAAAVIKALPAGAVTKADVQAACDAAVKVRFGKAAL